jgi:hypothetical protein
MRSFVFQLQGFTLQRNGANPAERLKSAIASCGGQVREEAPGPQPEGLHNFTVQSPEPATFWRAFRAKLETLGDIQERLIVVYQGTRGWDDYLLLYRFNKAERLDAFRA